MGGDDAQPAEIAANINTSTDRFMMAPAEGINN
jgi:hypothetical protein